MPRKFKRHENLKRVMSILREYLLAHTIIYRSVTLKKRNVADKIFRENQNTRFVFNEFSFPKVVPFMR